jgi:DMSO/TMAO reductase YedYZ molybdopterin-dependent catalytic subunit
MRNNQLIKVSIISIALIVSAFAIFNFLQDENIIIHYPNNEAANEIKDIYLEIGPKHVPKSTIAIFNEYEIILDLTPEEREKITPLEDFFIMGNRIPKDTERFAKVPDEYLLVISGNIEKQVTLSYSDLLTNFDLKYAVTELYCMPNLRGIGKFLGPSLWDIIDHVNPNNNASKVVVLAGDGYEWEFSIDEIKTNKEGYLLAMAMNDYPLAIEHGYPVRLAIPDEPGITWVKWIVEIRIE